MQNTNTTLMIQTSKPKILERELGKQL